MEPCHKTLISLSYCLQRYLHSNSSTSCCITLTSSNNRSNKWLSQCTSASRSCMITTEGECPDTSQASGCSVSSSGHDGGSECSQTSQNFQDQLPSVLHCHCDWKDSEATSSSHSSGSALPDRGSRHNGASQDSFFLIEGATCCLT